MTYCPWADVSVNHKAWERRERLVFTRFIIHKKKWYLEHSYHWLYETTSVTIHFHSCCIDWFTFPKTVLLIIVMIYLNNAWINRVQSTIITSVLWLFWQNIQYCAKILSHHSGLFSTILIHSVTHTIIQCLHLCLSSFFNLTFTCKHTHTHTLMNASRATGGSASCPRIHVDWRSQEVIYQHSDW